MGAMPENWIKIVVPGGKKLEIISDFLRQEFFNFAGGWCSQNLGKEN